MGELELESRAACCLVDDAEYLIIVLHQLMDGESCIVGLHHGTKTPLKTGLILLPYLNLLDEKSSHP